MFLTVCQKGDNMCIYDYIYGMGGLRHINNKELCSVFTTCEAKTLAVVISAAIDIIDIMRIDYAIVNAKSNVAEIVNALYVYRSDLNELYRESLLAGNTELVHAVIECGLLNPEKFAMYLAICNLPVWFKYVAEKYCKADVIKITLAMCTRLGFHDFVHEVTS